MKKNRIKLGIIEFTNCLPVIYALEWENFENIEIIKGNPAEINRLIKEKKVDVAPISSIEYIKNKNDLALIEESGISCRENCASVILFSRYKLPELDGKKIGLPEDSATSVAMLKIILREKNIKNVDFSGHNYEKSAKKFLKEDFDAVLFIGDNALKENFLKDKSYYNYDIGNLWRDLTGMPAVFGTWCSGAEWKKENRDNFQLISSIIKQAVEKGLSIYLNEIIEIGAKRLKLNKEVIKIYLTENIDFNFGEEHKKSLKLLEDYYNKLFMSD